MSLKEKQLEMKSNIDDNLVVENKKDICSTNSIQIQIMLTQILLILVWFPMIMI